MSLVNFVMDMPSQAVRGDILYEGSVVANNDPLKIGRVRVRVEQFFPKEAIETKHCPWAIMKRGGFGSTPNRSDFMVAEVGSKVLVHFNGGDIYSPIYETCPTDIGTPLTGTEQDYPATYGWTDPDGSALLVNTKLHTVEYKHQSGFQINIREGKQLEIICPQDFRIDITGDANINVAKKILMEAGTTLDINGTTTSKVNGGLALTLMATSVKVGSDSATDFVALKAALDQLYSYINTHTHTNVQSGASNSGQPTNPMSVFIPGVHHTIITKAS